MWHVQFVSLAQLLDRSGDEDIYVHLSANSNPDKVLVPGRNKNSSPSLKTMALHVVEVIISARLKGANGYGTWKYRQILGYTPTNDPRPTNDIRNSLSAQRTLFHELFNELAVGFQRSKNDESDNYLPRRVLRGIIGTLSEIDVFGTIDVPLDRVLRNLQTQAEAQAAKADSEVEEAVRSGYSHAEFPEDAHVAPKFTVVTSEGEDDDEEEEECDLEEEDEDDE